MNKKIIYKINDNSIDQIINILKNSGVICIPTDTVYGLICNATDDQAIDKIYATKQRDYSKPLILFIRNIDDANKFALTNENYYKLANKYFPGPLTIILKQKDKVNLSSNLNRTQLTSGVDSSSKFKHANEEQVLGAINFEDRNVLNILEDPKNLNATTQLTSGVEFKKTIGVRIPNNNLILKILDKIDFPLASTSANLSGEDAIHKFAELNQQIIQQCDLCIDKDYDIIQPPSTIVDCSSDKEIKIIRQGSIYTSDK